MRLHELSVTAFGPFVDTVEVDFAELGAGGVFLLTGDTGAGKTSVLDAVCFALYGDVPGDRHSARHLRSDHADPQSEARVVLRLTVGGRTFRFTRSPAWERPKRRGSGTTRVQAHVVVEEQRDDGWSTLTNRLDEAGQLVTSLLGMTCTQFTQVAMLPQGRFQAFLRASSTERQAVLQQLFRTRRFEEVERWLVERRLTLRRHSQTHHDLTAGVINRLQEASEVSSPPDWDLHDLTPVMESSALLPWAEELTRQARTDASALTTALTTATRTLDVARTSCDYGKHQAQARARGDQARASLTELARTADLEHALTSSVEAHRRATSVLPAALRVEAATDAATSSRATVSLQLGAAAQLLGQLPEELAPAQLTEAATRASEARAVAEAWLPREQELHDERSRLTALEAQLGRLEGQISTAESERIHLATERTRLALSSTEAAQVAGQLPGARAAVEAAQAGLEAAQRVSSLTGQLDEAQELLTAATRHAHDLREQHLDLREQRICGMAAELARQLAVGGACPVCGSAEHPSPAIASRQVSRADEEAARQRHETADFERQATQDSVTGLQIQLQVAEESSLGLGVLDWESTLARAATALRRAVDATQQLDDLGGELTALEQRATAVIETLASSRARRESGEQQLDASRSRCDSLSAELGRLLAAHGSVGSVARVVELHRHTVTVLEEAREALIAHERTAHELALATASADSAATAAGFRTPADAMAAVLTGTEAVARVSRLDARRTERATATAILDEVEVDAALQAPAPDLAALAAAVRAAEVTRDHAHAARERALARVRRLEALTGELADRVVAWLPVLRDHSLATALASLVEGRSADNLLKMRLSAYVLSERLREVVAAANERLADMTDQRYALEQADEKGAGEQRGGLSLRVRDEWSGKHRDPATLSGGETFVVSLALALGLADTVTHEAGGTQLDTLFIDEGFGALDATTLDGVMDTLDSLRDGGRVVGLVSHVAELRNRVPCQLEVRKARRGSTLHMSVALG